MRLIQYQIVETLNLTENGFGAMNHFNNFPYEKYSMTAAVL